MPLPERYAFGDFVLERTQRRVLRSNGSARVPTPRLTLDRFVMTRPGTRAAP